jgi:hypothetical protein
VWSSPPAVRVTDLQVHGQDMRRPAGLRFEAADLGWAWGAGTLDQAPGGQGGKRE